jgi:hypothetical protein
MTDHRRWLELAAAGPAFAPAPPDANGLAAHLASCRECSQRTVDLRADLAAVAAIRDGGLHEDLRERIRRAAAVEPGGLSPVLLVAIVGLLLALVVGGTLTVGSALLHADDGLPLPANMPDLSGKRLVWETPVVHFGADALDLEANGRTVHGLTTAMRVDGDPGGLSYWTLELTWPEAGAEQRINFYFKSDGTNWWIDELRAYDGVNPDPKWASFVPGRRAVTPMGGVFRGDITADGKGRTGAVDLLIRGVVLAVTPQRSFTDPVGGATQVGTDPFLPGGALHCSGILQLTPPLAERELLARGYRLSWRFESSTGANSGFAKEMIRAPAVGWITSTAVGSDGELILFVADPARPAGGPPLPFSADCAGAGSG